MAVALDVHLVFVVFLVDVVSLVVAGAAAVWAGPCHWCLLEKSQLSDLPK